MLVAYWVVEEAGEPDKVAVLSGNRFGSIEKLVGFNELVRC